MKKITGLLLLSLVLAGCSEKEYFQQIYIEDVKEYMEGNTDGFVLLVTENDEPFQEYVKEVAESEEVEIAVYNVYESEEGTENNRPVLPYDEFDRFSELYYVADNKVKDALPVTEFEDMKLTEEIKHFVELHN